MRKSLRRILSREVRRRGKNRAGAIESLESRQLLTIGLPSLVSVNSAGTAAGNGNPDTSQSLSADGRYLVFSDTSSNLVAGDANGTYDVFLRDLQTGTTTLVSRTAAGTAGNGWSYNGVISANGQYVAFYSDAQDLHLSGGPTPDNSGQIYRWDRLTGQSILVSVSSANDGASNSSNDRPSISADGSRIAFESHAINLLAGITDNNGTSDVYLRDLTTSITTLVSHASGDATTTANSTSYEPQISRDGSRVAYQSNATDLEAGLSDINGQLPDLISFTTSTGLNRYVAVEAPDPSTGNSSSERTHQTLSADGRYEVFSSNASDLVPGDRNGTWDVFLRDLQTGTTTLVSRTAEGSAGNGWSYNGVISADGRYVAFYSDAQDLHLSGGPVPDNSAQIYRWDRLTGQSVLVSVNSANNGASNSFNDRPSISADGSRIAFESSSTNLLAGITDSNGTRDVYVRDVSTGTTKLASRRSTSATITANDDSYSPRISRDGSTVVYFSLAMNLATGVTDSNSSYDVFAFDFAAGTNKAVSTRSTGTATGNNGVDEFDISDNGQVIAFSSFATNLVTGDTNGSSDIFVRDLSLAGVALERVSVDSNEAQGDNWSESPSISGDGNFVAFSSYSSNFWPTATSGFSQIYVRNRSAGTTTLVSEGDDAGVPIEADGYSYEPRISHDGLVVAFESNATNLDSTVADAAFDTDVYIRNWQAVAPTTTQVSRSSAGATAANAGSFRVALSDSGQRVLFQSNATDLLTGIRDSNGTTDLFSYDGSSVALSSQKGLGRFTGRDGVDPIFDQSDDGSVVVYSTSSPGIVADVEWLGYTQVYVRDVASDSTELISTNTAEEPADWYSWNPAISGDGRFVAFASQASNLSPLAANFSQQIYARDRVAGTTTLVSVNRLGTAGGNSTSDQPQISRDGSVIAFESSASDLQTGVSDGNSDRDVFVRNWRAVSPLTETASRRSTGTSTGNRPSYSPSISEDGTTISFVSNGNNLVAGISDPIDTPDIFAVRSIGLSVNSVTADEGDSGTTNFQFTVTLLSPSTQTVTVDYETLDGSATTADGDYTAISGTLTFNPGETTKVITVSVVGDVAIEPNEAFSLRLFNAVNAGIVVGNATGTIRDDDNLAVAGVTINSGAAQRSNLETIDVRFTGATNIPDLITAGTIGQAVTLVTSAGAPVSLTGARFAYTAATRTLTVDLTLDGFGSSARTMLADGRYELRLDTTLIHFAGDPARLLQDDGTPDGFVNLSFHRFDSDFDGDGAVTYADRDLLFAHYGSSLGQLKYDLAFDLDGNGIINSRDYLWLRRRIGLSL